ncbi:hypothetical protein CXB51_021806 [Gossypium anomalum]|uniref:Uncharacterized protein n=1 Tax=Gossypium anomalum TaxID=47600 RepID=A0A8J5YMM6_9ROSI|nr:hypothetical protein CXB51_021806 [Gossypium anomalum]
MGAILNEGDKALTTLPETGIGSVTDVGTDMAIVVGGGAHDAAKWGSRREGQLLCC